MKRPFSGIFIKENYPLWLVISEIRRSGIVTAAPAKGSFVLASTTLPERIKAFEYPDVPVNNNKKNMNILLIFM